MELNELIAPAVPHKGDNSKCPFCPIEKPPTYTTIPGDGNDSTTLGDNMDAGSVEGGTRPKKPPKGRRKKQLERPAPIGTHPDPNIGPYSSEPHHLISGKQALAHNGEHGFEDWIKASAKIEADTGYSVNNFDNGLWMPSVPENTKGIGGAWDKMDRKAVAEYIMAKTKRQFHKGAHNIPETKLVGGVRVRVADDQRLHKQYDRYLIDMLKAMSGRMGEWAAVCGLCQDRRQAGQKYQPSVRVNEALDRLSDAASRKITGSRKKWRLFISTLAYLYHEEVCKCHRGRM